ncbi:hypothetical protein HWB19_gp118 [Cronobacter phage vB_CsaP_009]|uniref:Uncharacterized protein n=1 Tax=Cronobacter phage vB_CsaP_009 TaxID=2699738 RepID=A0A679FC68_9CAUD|nr:hypothetical protein HWB19_gp118 [Cronobacter phage vB_CsaP_009]BBU72764.1 hypothetical protein [Cronobacter phage vB_CsaP_009]
MKVWWEVESRVRNIPNLKIDAFSTASVIRRPTRKEARSAMYILKRNAFFDVVQMYKVTVLEENGDEFKILRERKR